MHTIDVPSEPRPRLVVDLGGDRYEFKIPKSYALMRQLVEMKQAGEDEQAQIAFFEQIVFGALDDADAARLKGRLSDADDPLDITHIEKVMELLSKEASERPLDDTSGSS